MLGACFVFVPRRGMVTGPRRSGDVPVVDHLDPPDLSWHGVTTTEALQLAEDRPFWREASADRFASLLGYYYYYYYYLLCIRPLCKRLTPVSVFVVVVRVFVIILQFYSVFECITLPLHRTRSGLHRIPEGCHQASCFTFVGHSVLHHDHLPWPRQPGYKRFVSNVNNLTDSYSRTARLLRRNTNSCPRTYVKEKNTLEI